MVTFTVPRRLQRKLRELLVRRQGLNKLPALVPGCEPGSNWYRQSASVYEALQEIEHELRRIAKAPRRSHVEYFTGYQFRCLDARMAHREYLVASGKKKMSRQKEKAGPQPGNTWSNQLPERSSICFETIAKCTSCPHVPPEKMPATLEDVLGKRRRKTHG
jgi:hypothetical protein